MSHVAPRPITPEERFSELVRAFLGRPGVTQEGKGFGSSALKVRGRIFAMLSRGDFVVKLPRRRVDELIASGDGDRFDPGHGRLMKEWLALWRTSAEDWVPLATEAMEFVLAGSRGGGARRPVRVRCKYDVEFEPALQESSIT